MRRREFIAGLGSAAALPAVARAQQGGRVRRIGVLMLKRIRQVASDRPAVTHPRWEKPYAGKLHVRFWESPEVKVLRATRQT